ncbi:hypothetical protein B0H21DRAFT_702254 [Amylocystis lapponica]|nr:hypothetical protein B0H21DRAFT_702254 [Amylocystis lapponica]
MFESTIASGSKHLQLQVLVNQLSDVFNTLLETLPLNLSYPTFGLDFEDIKDIGYSGALNKCLHRVWGYNTLGLVVDQHGPKLSCTLGVFESIVSLMKDPSMAGHWLKALIQCAIAAGACPEQ